MKIGIDISQIVYQTGVSRYTTELVKHLLRNDSDNYYFLYGGSIRQKQTLKTFVNQLKTKKVSVKISSLSPKLAHLFWNKLNLFLPDSHQNLDLFHASNWALPQVKCPLVTTIHDLTFLKHPQTHTKNMVKTHTRHLNRAKKYAKIIITDSDSTKKDLIDYGFIKDKIKVIYLASSTGFKPINNQQKINQVLNRYNLTKPFILSVGTQEPRKNIKRLIKAYQTLNLKKTKLVLVGQSGWGKITKPTSGVQWLGFVPDKDLKVLYSTAKVFVYPSLYEGFGFPILEAFSCGCPVITSNLSSLPEVGGDAAIYIDPKSESSLSSAINQVLKLKPSNYRVLVKKSFNQAKRFSWEKTAQETLKVYREATKC